MDERVMDYRIQRWIPVIEAQANSGLSVGKLCEINHISRSTFHRWSARVRNYILDNKQTATDSEFVEVFSTSQICFPSAAVDVPVSGRVQDGGLTISYAGYTININSNTDKNILIMALKAIREC